MPRTICSFGLSLRLPQTWPLVASGEAQELPKGSWIPVLSVPWPCCAGVARKWNPCTAACYTVCQVKDYFTTWNFKCFPQIVKSNKLSFSSDLGKNKAVKFWPFPSVKCLQMVSGRSWCIHCSDGLQQGSSWVGNEKGNDLVKLCETCCWFLAWNEYCSLAPGAAPRVSVKTMGLILCVCVCVFI